MISMKRFLLLSLTLAYQVFGSGFFGTGGSGGGGGSDPNKWDLAGNSGTDPASNFVGTTDAQDLVLKANSSERFRLLEGSVASRFIGTLQLKGSTNSNTVGLLGPVLAGSYTLTLPTALPGSTLPLVSTSAGVTSFSLIDAAAMLTGLTPLANGGTNKNITPVIGSIPYLDADSFETLAPGTATFVLTTQGAGLPPVWAPGGGSGGVYTADGEGIEVTLNEFSLELADSSLTKDASGLAVDWDINPYKGQIFQDSFSGDGVTTAFVLNQDPANENNTFVYVSGVYQDKSTYSITGTTITFSGAPPSGTGNIEVMSTVPLASVSVAANSIGSLELQDDAVETANIADNAVTSANILNGTILNADLADDSVTTAKVLNGTLLAEDLASDSVTTVKIVDSNVTTNKIADDNVTTAKILNLNVTTAKLAADAVTSAKILDETIIEADLADEAVTSDKIADGTITSDDLAPGAITLANLPSVNSVVSTASGAYSTTSSSYTGVTNLSVSITTSGRPIELYMASVRSSAQSDGVSFGGASQDGGLAFYRGASEITDMHLDGRSYNHPCSSFRQTDFQSSGTYTYSIRVKANTGTIHVDNCILVAREL